LVHAVIIDAEEFRAGASRLPVKGFRYLTVKSQQTMSTHQAEITWNRAHGEQFTDKRYSRAHSWRFDGGIVLPASSSPHAVPIPFSKPEHVDPEEAFVAAIAACHMLTFLWAAAKAGFVVDSYYDAAIGHLKKNECDRFAVTDVVLSPIVAFSGTQVPTETDVLQLHDQAHDECFIANSIHTTIAIQGTWSHASNPS
jgi:organic hydroperoxide reductase OsmC/OhrA